MVRRLGHDRWKQANNGWNDLTQNWAKARVFACLSASPSSHFANRERFRERRYVLNYSSWISPGVFKDPSFADVAALSHEMAELFNDPFVNNTTPWWLAPNNNCQNNLETGDVIEGLPHATMPIVLKGVTYHVQNEALLQWFAGQTPSSAIGGAYSYPDKTVLTSASKSLKPGCP